MKKTKPFLFEINTEISGYTDTNEFVLPLAWKGKATINWGDGVNTFLSSPEESQIAIQHVYARPGKYIIGITGKRIGLSFSNIGDKEKITNIIEWGCYSNAVAGAFWGCKNMTCTDVEAPKLGKGSSLVDFFKDCISLFARGYNVSNWDISNVKVTGFRT